VINFFGLVLISSFEDFTSMSLNKDKDKKYLLSDEFKKCCLTIARTTSRKALSEREEHKIQEIEID